MMSKKLALLLLGLGCSYAYGITKPTDACQASCQAQYKLCMTPVAGMSVPRAACERALAECLTGCVKQ